MEVTAYTGQAEKLLGYRAVSTVTFQIHTVETNHVSQVRRIRGLEGESTEAE